MKNKVIEIVRDATLSLDHERANAVVIATQLNLSRNLVSQYLNEFESAGNLIKINTRPVIFFDRNVLEEEYDHVFEKCNFGTLKEFKEYIQQECTFDFEKLIGYNESLSQVVDKCRATISYPPHGLPLLLHGPTGTGKSLIAQTMYDYLIHQNLITVDKKFIILNCSEYANNPELLSANLFGYKKGAFTGADKDNPGLLKIAEGGLLFLDEVHALKAECQEKLFLFMDKGIYHMVGDNETWYQSNVRFVFATTEDPNKVLLKTLLRRIPMTITLPSLAERGVHERVQLIYHIFMKEAKRLKRKIRFSNLVYNALLTTTFTGNIGDLKNCIQAACVSSYFKSDPKNNQLEIHIYDLPPNLIDLNDIQGSRGILDQQSTMIELNDLKKYIGNERSQVRLNNQILSVHKSFQHGEISFADLLDQSFQAMEIYTDQVIFKKDLKLNSGFLYIQSILQHVFDIIAKRYNLRFSNNDVLTLTTYIYDYTRYNYELRNYVDSQKDQISQLYVVLKKKLKREFLIGEEIAETIHANIDVEIDDMVNCLFTLYIKKFNKVVDSNKRIAIILAHGYSTASSIADASNRLLDQYIFDALDMPLQVSTDVIIERLNEYLDKIGSYEEIILLVDMGSLEDIYKGIVNTSRANIGIINNVTIKMALEVGSGIRLGSDLDSILKSVSENALPSHHIIHYQRKDPIILCSCASGLGTAERLKKILIDSLPTSFQIKIQTYDYNALIEKHLSDDFFQHYEVICIIGTLNPNIEKIPFIPIEDLIINVSLDKLHHYFKDYLSIEELKLFKSNILKNFSLTNIMNTLTILNPSKLLEHVAHAIDQLQIKLDIVFSNNTCVGLYVHVCCLIERLVMHQSIERYPDIELFQVEHHDFIEAVKEVFHEVENYYVISITPAEIGFIYDYVDNNQNTLVDDFD